MREAFDPWTFIAAAYAIGLAGTAAMVGWSWIGMRNAEKRRDRSRER